MVKLTNLIIVLASGLAVTAFSLNAHVSRPNGIPALKKSTSASPKQRHQRVPTVLLSSEGTADIVAANSASPAAKTESKGLLSSIWNENTKLTFYLAVWYLGNIYCK